MRVALVQCDIAWQDRAANLARGEAHVRGAVARGASLIVFPELFACGFTMDTSCAEPEGGPTEAWACRMAAAHGVHVVVGVPQRRAGDASPRNVALLAAPDGTVSRYAKTHRFSFSDEHLHYAAGDVLVTWEVGGLRLAPLICYDLRFPEAFRPVARDVDAFLVIASWPERRAAHWRTLLRARAIENQAWVLGVNRVGEGDGLRYRGDSAAVDPWGEPHVEAAHAETVLVVDVDPATVARARETFPPLRDVRTDLRRA